MRDSQTECFDSKTEYFSLMGPILMPNLSYLSQVQICNREVACPTQVNIKWYLMKI